MPILWIIFISALGMFVILYYFFAKAAIRRPEEQSFEFKTVYAGAAAPEHQGDSPCYRVDLTTSVFLDEKGEHVKIDEYNGFFVSGDSMELANIRDGNLLLVKKDYAFSDGTPLPGVFVLKREHPRKDEAEYKLRRVWAIAYLNETNVESLAKGILNHPEFLQLRRNNGFWLDEDKMLAEFTGQNGRLDIYKKEHPSWNVTNSVENRIVVSTTLRKEQEGDYHTENGRHIAFSIHPANLVVGKVEHVYANVARQKNI